MTDMLNVVGVLFLVLVFTSGNVERSLWLFLNTVDTLRALKVVRANGRVIGVRTRRKHLREALVCWISFPLSWLADKVLGWFPFYRSIKTLAGLVCAYWRLESSALFHQIVVVPLFKRYEKQTDLTLSLLHAIFGVAHHLLFELPTSVILSVLRPLKLSPRSANAATPGRAPTTANFVSPTRPLPKVHSPATQESGRHEPKHQPRRVSPSSKTSKLPEWPPMKRSVYSEEPSANRKTSNPKPLGRSTKPPHSKAVPKPTASEVPVPRRRTASGASRVVARTEPPGAGASKPEAKASQATSTEKAMAAKLKSLPRPPSGDPEDSSSSSASRIRSIKRSAKTPTAKSHEATKSKTHDAANSSSHAVTKTKPHSHDGHSHLSPKKRSRDRHDEGATLPLKRRASRKTATATGDEEEGEGVAVGPSPKHAASKNRAAQGSQGVQRPSSAAARPKARTVSSSTASATAKRARATDKEADTVPPKRTRSTRSTAGTRSTS